MSRLGDRSARCSLTHTAINIMYVECISCKQDETIIIYFFKDVKCICVLLFIYTRMLHNSCHTDRMVLDEETVGNPRSRTSGKRSKNKVVELYVWCVRKGFSRSHRFEPQGCSRCPDRTLYS